MILLFIRLIVAVAHSLTHSLTHSSFNNDLILILILILPYLVQVPSTHARAHSGTGNQTHLLLLQESNGWMDGWMAVNPSSFHLERIQNPSDPLL